MKRLLCFSDESECCPVDRTGIFSAGGEHGLAEGLGFGEVTLFPVCVKLGNEESGGLIGDFPEGYDDTGNACDEERS